MEPMTVDELRKQGLLRAGYQFICVSAPDFSLLFTPGAVYDAGDDWITTDRAGDRNSTAGLSKFIHTESIVSNHEEPEQQGISDGGSSDYYRIPEHASELRHLISARGMSKSRGDIFKACYRLGEKSGVDVKYDLNKMKFFIEDLIEMHERGEHL